MKIENNTKYECIWKVIVPEQSSKSKVESILKGSMDFIPAPPPSVKIQIMPESLLEV